MQGCAKGRNELVDFRGIPYGPLTAGAVRHGFLGAPERVEEHGFVEVCRPAAAVGEELPLRVRLLVGDHPALAEVHGLNQIGNRLMSSPGGVNLLCDEFRSPRTANATSLQSRYTSSSKFKECRAGALLMGWGELVGAAVAGALAMKAVDLASAPALTWLRRRPRKVMVFASYQPIQGAVTIEVRNMGAEDVTIRRVTVHARSPLRDPSEDGTPVFPPLELEWANLMGDVNLGSRGSTVFPQGWAHFTAGHVHLANHARRARRMRVQIDFDGERRVVQRVNLVRLRRQFSQTQEYQLRPGERLVPSPHLSFYIPSYPPRKEPAMQIVKEGEEP